MSCCKHATLYQVKEVVGCYSAILEVVESDNNSYLGHQVKVYGCIVHLFELVDQEEQDELAFEMTLSEVKFDDAF